MKIQILNMNQITTKIWGKIYRLERENYPEEMWQLGKKKSSIFEYLEEPEIWFWGSGYILWDGAELADWCGSHTPLVELWNLIKERKTTFFGSARESTSYRVLSAMAKRGKIKMVINSEWDWDGEKMYDFTVTVK